MHVTTKYPKYMLKKSYVSNVTRDVPLHIDERFAKYLQGLKD